MRTQFRTVHRSLVPIVIFAACAVLILSAAVSGFAAETDALRLIPGSCNAVAIVETRDLVDSPLGRREKWSDAVRRAYAEGLLSSPPWVKEMIQGTVVGSPAAGPPLTYSVYVTGQLMTVDDIAKHELSHAENLAGHQAVLSPRNVYFVQFSPGLIGALQPANRQAAAHWLESAGQRSAPSISTHLADTLSANDKAQVVVAVDLKDMLHPRHIRNWIMGTPKLRNGGDIDALATLLSGLRMARLSVHVDNSIVARLRLDFDAPVGQNASRVEQAVAQWLDDAGARPQMMAAAKAQVSGQSVTFEAPIDEVGLRRLLSLLQSPHLPPKEAAAESREPNAVASEVYYNRVCTLLNTLLSRNRNATGYEKTALWHVEFARKIAELSPTAVDPSLLRWGRDVSKELVALASSLRGESVRLDDLQRSIRVDDTTMYNWAGAGPYGEPFGFPVWVYSDSNLDLVRAQQDAAVQKSAGDRDAIWNMLREETTAIAKQTEHQYHIKLKLPD
jgi:hypothetical protein